MQTLHPEVWISEEVPYELRNKSVRLYRCEKRKREAQNLGLSFEDFLAYGLPFALVRILRRGIQLHL